MMKAYWNVDEIIEHFILLPEEVRFLGSNDPHNQLGKELQKKFFQSEGQFPEDENEFTPEIIEPRMAQEIVHLNDAVMSIARELKLDLLLQRIPDAARELVGAQYAALGMSGAKGGLEVFFVQWHISGTGRTDITSANQGGFVRGDYQGTQGDTPPAHSG